MQIIKGENTSFQVKNWANQWKKGYQLKDNFAQQELELKKAKQQHVRLSFSFKNKTNKKNGTTNVSLLSYDIAKRTIPEVFMKPQFTWVN